MPLKLTPPTETQLRAMSPEARATVRANAIRAGEAGTVTVALIDALNLPLSSGGMSQDDPLYREMEEIAWSAASKKAALDAVAAGLPAMAGVDPLLQAAMGARYSAEQQGTMNAGYIVGAVMRHLGYEKASEAPLPKGCVAKTGATWVPKKPLA